MTNSDVSIRISCSQNTLQIHTKSSGTYSNNTSNLLWCLLTDCSIRKLVIVGFYSRDLIWSTNEDLTSWTVLFLFSLGDLCIAKNAGLLQFKEFGDLKISLKPQFFRLKNLRMCSSMFLAARWNFRERTESDKEGRAALPVPGVIRWGGGRPALLEGSFLFSDLWVNERSGKRSKDRPFMEAGLDSPLTGPLILPSITGVQFRLNFLGAMMFDRQYVSSRPSRASALHVAFEQFLEWVWYELNWGCMGEFVKQASLCDDTVLKWVNWISINILKRVLLSSI